MVFVQHSNNNYIIARAFCRSEFHNYIYALVNTTNPPLRSMLVNGTVPGAVREGSRTFIDTIKRESQVKSQKSKIKRCI